MNSHREVVRIATIAKEGGVGIAGNAAASANRDGAGFCVAGYWRKVE